MLQMVLAAAAVAAAEVPIEEQHVFVPTVVMVMVVQVALGVEEELAALVASVVERHSRFTFSILIQVVIY